MPSSVSLVFRLNSILSSLILENIFLFGQYSGIEQIGVSLCSLKRGFLNYYYDFIFCLCPGRIHFIYSVEKFKLRKLNPYLFVEKVAS